MTDVYVSTVGTTYWDACPDCIRLVRIDSPNDPNQGAMVADHQPTCPHWWLWRTNATKKGTR